MKQKVPKVAVLLASHNGVDWISEQIDSILAQRDIDVRIIVSDDASTDGTIELLKKISLADTRIEIMPCITSYGSAGKNFYRLIVDSDITDCDYVALADQDDIWLKSKLKSQISLLNEHDAFGVSSNVVAFWPDGSRALIDKAAPQRRLDFLFESAGPGCTFLLMPSLIEQVRKLLLDNKSQARQVVHHDWLIYAVCRALGEKLFISPVPTINYRQHDRNVVGVNFGFKAYKKRFSRVLDGWYRAEVIKICMVCKELSSDAYLNSVCNILTYKLPFSRFRLLSIILEARRAKVDRAVLALASLLFLF